MPKPAPRTRDELIELAKPSAGGFDIDIELLGALGWHEERPGYWTHPNGSTWQDPMPSQSLKHAKRLLRPAWVLQRLDCTFDLEDIPLSGPRVKHWTATIAWYTPDGQLASTCQGEGQTEALAVCEAALFALAISLRSTVD